MIVEWIFRQLFSAFKYTFRRSDDRISEMKEAERTEYYRQAKDLLENRVYLQEMEELVRRYYQELALKTRSKLEQQAYRLTLKAVQELDGRVRNLASMYAPPNISGVKDRL